MSVLVTSVTHPTCSRVGTLKAGVPPGTQVRCPGCGDRSEAVGEAPGAGAGLDDVGPRPDGSAFGVASAPVVRVQPLPPFGSVPVDPEFAPSLLFKPSPPTPPAYPPVPPEPWFYRWIDGIAAFLWWSALVALGFAIFVVVLLLVLASMSSGQVDPWGAAAAGYFIMAAIVGLIPTALASALLHLAVDAARNFRAIRYR